MIDVANEKKLYRASTKNVCMKSFASSKNNCFCVLFVFSEHYFDKYIFVNLGSMSVNQLALAHVFTKWKRIIIYISQKQNNWVPFVIEIDKDYVISIITIDH